MKHYKSPTGSVHAYELDGSQDHLIDAAMTLMTGAQVEAHRNPPAPVPTPLQTLAKMDSDRALTQRELREFIVLTAYALKKNAVVDLTAIPVVAKAVAIEADADIIRKGI